MVFHPMGLLIDLVEPGAADGQMVCGPVQQLGRDRVFQLVRRRERGVGQLQLGQQ
jgi:hypothetical protein